MILQGLRSEKKSFTLVEIMVVVGIIAILSSLAAVSVIRSRRTAMDNYILQFLRGYADACQLYYAAQGRWPSVVELTQGSTPYYTTPANFVFFNDYYASGSVSKTDYSLGYFNNMGTSPQACAERSYRTGSMTIHLTTCIDAKDLQFAYSGWASM